MPLVNKPKKKKLYYYWYLLLSRTGTAGDTMYSQTRRLDPLMEISDGSWTEAQGDAWAEAESLCDGYTEGRTDTQIGSDCSTLGTLLTAAGL